MAADQVGDLAERGLARLDPVAAIQFASVYRNLADLDELEAVVRRFKEEPLPGAGELALDTVRSLTEQHRSFPHKGVRDHKRPEE